VVAPDVEHEVVALDVEHEVVAPDVERELVASDDCSRSSLMGHYIWPTM